jgi:predicted phage terminase large subunit-like protein
MPWFHKTWYEALDNPKIKRLYIQAAREHAKTSSILNWCVRCIALNRRIRIGIISQTDDLAMGFMAQIRNELETNEQLLRDYGDFRPLRAGTQYNPWSNHQIRVIGGAPPKDVTVFAAGAGTQITGKHCDILIFDDIETSETVKTAEMRQSTKSWVAKEAMQVLSPGGKAVVTGTRKHVDDFYSLLLKEGTGWTVLSEAKSVYQPDGSPTWPEKWTLENIELKKAELDASDVSAFPQEMLNEPMSMTGRKFEPDNWPTYLPNQIPDLWYVVQGWDLAITEKQENDQSAQVTIGCDRSYRTYLLSAWAGRLSINDLMDQINAWGSQPWDGKRPLIAIEENAFQLAAVQLAVSRMPWAIEGYRTQKLGDKVARAALPESRAKSGMVVRPEMAPWWPDFSLELKQFPNGSHDDYVDALSIAFHKLNDLLDSAPAIPPVSIPKGQSWNEANPSSTEIWGARRKGPGGRFDRIGKRKSGWLP